MPLSHADLLQLKRWNTPTIFNGWEQVTSHDVATEGVNIDEVRDFMPQMGVMVGYAVTVVIEPSNKSHRQNARAWQDYCAYMADLPGPKIVVVQDLDKPRTVGSLWGEVSSNIHRTLGCVGTITDGGIRDLDEMTNAGFKALARRLCVGHAYVTPVRWGCTVEVFGQTVQPGCLIHADKHGFLAIPDEDQDRLLAAARFMDANECQTVIPAARSGAGRTTETIVAGLDTALDAYRAAVAAQFRRDGEW